MSSLWRLTVPVWYTRSQVLNWKRICWATQSEWDSQCKVIRMQSKLRMVVFSREQHDGNNNALCHLERLPSSVLSIGIIWRAWCPLFRLWWMLNGLPVGHQLYGKHFTNGSRQKSCPSWQGSWLYAKSALIVDDSIGEPLQSVEQSMPNSNCLLWPSLILLWCLNNRDNCASYKVYFCPPLFLGGLIELHMLTSRKWCPLEVVTYVTAHSEHMQLFLCHSLHQRQARIQDFQRKGNWKLL